MTTPPPPDNAPEPAAEWAPPGAPPAAENAPPEPPAPPLPHVHGPQAPLIPRTNRLAIAALVTGLLGLVLIAVGLGIAALLQAGRRGGKGKGLAVGGLVASAVWTVAVAVAIVAVLGSLVTADRDGTGQVTGNDRVLLAALRVGDCFTGFQGESSRALVTALPCTRPHDGEVVGKLQLPDDEYPGHEYPGEEEIAERADEACTLKTLHLQKSRYARDLEPYNVWPSRTTWDLEDREVICLQRYTGSGTLTAPLDQTLDASLKIWYELTPGDCLGKWDEESLAQRTVSCTEPHWIQVYATFTAEPGPYPGPKAMERSGKRGCEKRWEKVFRGRRAPDLISWIYPEKPEWEFGRRTVVCFGESEDRPMKKSMLPR